MAPLCIGYLKENSIKEKARCPGTFAHCDFNHYSLIFHLPYSREKKHVLLFRKSEICLFKVSITNTAAYFFRNKTFFFLKIESWNFQHLIDLEFRESSQNFSSFGQLLFFIVHVTKWIEFSYRSLNFEISLWCLQFSQKGCKITTPRIFSLGG